MKLVKNTILILTILSLGCLCESEEDYYKILEVKRNATKKEIKKVFRKLSKKYHPDVAKDKEEAKRIFPKVNEAYDVLSDDDKR